MDLLSEIEIKIQQYKNMATAQGIGKEARIVFDLVVKELEDIVFRHYRDKVERRR